MNQINKKLGEYLLKPGASRSQIAQQLGISTPSLNYRITGKRKWKWSEVVMLAEILGCNLDDLRDKPENPSAIVECE